MNAAGFTWWIDRDKIGIATTSDYGTTFTSAPTSGVDNVRIWSTDLADKFSIGASIDLTEESDIPEMFRDALISKVNQMIYEKTPETIQLAQYWDVKYRESVLEAKKWANQNRTEGCIVKGEHY